MGRVQVKCEQLSLQAELPEYKTAGSAGADLRACIKQDIILKPGQRVLVPTGLKIELPSGFEAQIRPRSGLAVNHGVTLVNTPGTIDADYRGEIKIILINWGQADFVIKNGDRIAQMVIAPYVQADYVAVESVQQTTRGESGFGSTGR